jgi:hypothetical protein
MNTDQVIVLNTDYTFLNTVSVIKAIKMIAKGKAEVVIENTKNAFKNFENTVKFFIPQVIKLVKMVRMAFGKSVPLTKSNIFVRDNFTCQYCGKKFNKKSKSLTIDHVIPKSKNGKNTWENWVTSCNHCNIHVKKDRTPNEAGLTLLKKPVKPTIGEFIQLRSKQSGLDKILDEVFKKMV